MKVCKRSPIGPRHVDPRQNSGPKDAPKHSTREAAESGGQRPSQPGRGHHHGPWWLPRSNRGDCHGRGGHVFPPVLRFLQRSFNFHAAFSSIKLLFAFKRDEYGCKKGRFPQLRNSLTHSNSIGEIGRRRKGIKQKQRHSGEIEGSSLQPLNKLL